MDTNDTERNIICSDMFKVHSPRILPGDPAYAPKSDCIYMPEMQMFASEQEYYAALFHELAHWTGHSSRLNREMCTYHNSEGIETYSKEELAAEMSASFLCSYFGIESPALNENQEVYISGWLQKLKGDSHLLVHAASKAQQVVDYLLGDDQEQNIKEEDHA